MKLEGAVKNSSEGCYISIEVTPNSKKTKIKGYNEWRKAIEVSVKAPPKGGKANAEVESLFSKLFGKAKIVKGFKSHQKVVFVDCDCKSVVSKLNELISK